MAIKHSIIKLMACFMTKRVFTYLYRLQTMLKYIERKTLDVGETIHYSVHCVRIVRGGRYYKGRRGKVATADCRNVC